MGESHGAGDIERTAGTCYRAAGWEEVDSLIDAFGRDEGG